MEERSELSVVIDGKVYRLSGGSDIYLQKLASYVDGKIRELKKQRCSLQRISVKLCI